MITFIYVNIIPFKTSNMSLASMQTDCVSPKKLKNLPKLDHSSTKMQECILLRYLPICVKINYQLEIGYIAMCNVHLNYIREIKSTSFKK